MGAKKRFLSFVQGNRKLIWISAISVAAIIGVAASLLVYFNSQAGNMSRHLYTRYASLKDHLDAGEEGAKLRQSRYGRPEEIRFGGASYYIRSLRQAAPGRQDWPLSIPEGKSRLEFTVGYVAEDDVDAGEIDVEVSIESDSSLERLYSKSIPIEPDADELPFFHEKIPLDRYAGKEVKIIFESSQTSSDAEGVEVMWGDPTVFAEQRTSLANIVLICLDTLRADRTKYYNPDTELTPTLDALAKDGVVFKHAISQSPWTLPSVTTVLTGLYPSLHGTGKRTGLGAEMTQDDLDEERQQQGMILGKSEHLLSKLPSGIPTLPELINDKYTCHTVAGNMLLCESTDVISRFPSYVNGTWQGMILLRHARQWLNENRDKLFFLYVHFMEPHEYYRLRRDRNWEKGDYDAEAARELYDKFVAKGDHVLRQFIGYLKDLGLYDTSLIIFYSDHGEHLYDPGWDDVCGHGNTLCSKLLEVPLIVKFPFSKYAGTEVNRYVKLMDLFKTILEETGAEITDPIYNGGESLRIAISDSIQPVERETVSEYMLYGEEEIAVQAGKFRLIYNYDNEGYTLLNTLTDERLRWDSDSETKEVFNRLGQSLLAYLALIRNRDQAIERADFTEEELKGIQRLGYLQ